MSKQLIDLTTLESIAGPERSHELYARALREAPILRILSHAAHGSATEADLQRLVTLGLLPVAAVRSAA